MDTPKVKICGMRNSENAKQILKFKPDFLGFIFYEKSKRFVSDNQMNQIMKLEFGHTHAVGVFVNEDLNKIIEKAKRGYFKHVQLHGDEGPEEVKILKNAGLIVIKVFAVDDDFNFNTLQDYADADFFLFDTKGKLPGGNGVKFNWNILKNNKIKKPFFLSGGLSIEDLKLLDQLQSTELYALDFNSKLELEPGLKDFAKVKEVLSSIG